MGVGDDLLGLLPIGHLREGHIERDGDVEAALLGCQQRHLAVDRDVADLFVLAPSDDADRALETGGVSDREQLFRIGAPLLAGASHFLGHP